MAKDEYISTTGLYKIRDRLSQSANGGKNAAVENESDPQMAGAPVPRERKFDQALQARHEEFRKLKRDISARYAETIAALSEKLDGMKNSAVYIEHTLEFISGKQQELDSLDDDWGAENYTAQLAAAMKTLDNLRLELIRQNSRLAEKTSTGGNGNDNSRTSTSLLPELSSLSFKQLFRMGSIFMLPLILTTGLGAMIIAFAIYMAMRF